MVRFKPLASVRDGIYQSLLTVDGSDARVLIDAGWNPSLDARLDNLTAEAKSIDMILLTHATVSHLGAYCYMCKTVPEFSQVPVFATVPVVAMGKLVVEEAYRSKGLCGPFRDPFLSVNEVREFFDKIKTVKYSQPLSLSALGNSRLSELTITAYNSGHSLGGTLWKISQEAETVVAAIDWNHSRDNHLNGAFLESGGKINEQLTKPSLLLLSTSTSDGIPAKQNRAALLENIQDTIRRGGTVLIPTSTGSRALELILILDKLMSENDLRVPLIYLSTVGKRVLAQASSMLEWMLSSIIDAWQVKNNSPFDIQRLKFVSSMDEMKTYKGVPKIVLTTDAFLELGQSRKALMEFSESPESLIVLTEKAPPNTFANELYTAWRTKAQIKGVNSFQLGQTFRGINVVIEAPLQGEQLIAYRKELEEAKKEEEINIALEKRNKNILEQDTTDDYSSGDEDDQVVSGHMDLEILTYGDGIYDFDLVRDHSENANRVRMFPFVHQKSKKDEYGEILRDGQFEIKSSLIDEVGEVSPSNGQSNDSASASIHEIDVEDAQLGQARNWRESVQSEIPLQMTEKTVDVKVACMVTYIDFNGWPDARSTKMIISQVQASQVIALPGSVDTSVLGPNVRDGSVEVFLEQKNKSLNVELDFGLEESLAWQEVPGNFTVAHVAAKITFDTPTTGGPELSHHVINDSHTTSQLKRPRKAILQPLEGPQNVSNDTIMVGDVQLAQLKHKLLIDGISSEFRSQGVLICNNKVIVRKISEGRLAIDGGLEPEFYAVRAAIKSFLATV